MATATPLAGDDALEPLVPPAEIVVEPPPAVPDAAPTPYPAERLTPLDEPDVGTMGRLRSAEESGSGGGTL
jgi:hypothetical protein